MNELAEMKRYLRQVLKEEECSWHHLAGEIGVSTSTLCRIGQGKRPGLQSYITILEWIKKRKATEGFLDLLRDDPDAPSHRLEAEQFAKILGLCQDGAGAFRNLLEILADQRQFTDSTIRLCDLPIREIKALTAKLEDELAIILAKIPSQ